MNFLKLLFAAFALTIVAAEAGADGFGRPEWGFGRGRPGPGYQYHWQYAGQVQAPIHGSPAVHGINYCNTEQPTSCWQPGALCYVNNGYWWDNRNQCNWFNYYRCQ